MDTELTPEKLFEIVLEEAMRDGQIQEHEAQRMHALKVILGISQEQHDTIFQKVRVRLESANPEARSFDRLVVYQKCLLVAAADGKGTPAEVTQLEVLQKILGISKTEHDDAMAKVKTWLGERK